MSIVLAGSSRNASGCTSPGKQKKEKDTPFESPGDGLKHPHISTPMTSQNYFSQDADLWHSSLWA